jgi:hypothetical protein
MIEPNILLVKGIDDLHVVSSLLAARGFPDAFKISAKGGVDRVLDTLPVQIKATGTERVGIVIDADVNISGRWGAVRAILERAGYDPPRDPPADGLVLSQGGLPRVAVWIMPDNQVPGMLEHFIECLIPKDDILYPKARDSVASLEGNERRFSDAHEMKANVHTWLAWQADPGTPLGLAITKQYLSSDRPSADRFIAWLDRCFVQ